MCRKTRTYPSAELFAAVRIRFCCQNFIAVYEAIKKTDSPFLLSEAIGDTRN
jgi:hypothetical protein